MADNIFEKYFNTDYPYFVFRVFVGLLFAQHGFQKLFGMFGGKAAELFSLMGLAGTVEFIGGLAIAFGLFTRLAAFISAVEMLVAYFMAHAGTSLIPIINKGELALLYFASFLVLMVYGAKKWSLESAILKKEVF